MTNRYLLICLHFLAAISMAPLAAASAAGALMTAPGGLAVTGDEVVAEAATRVGADVLTQVLAQRISVTQFATNVLLRRALAEEAEQAQLDKDSKIALQLRLARERVLADAMMERIDAGSRPDREAIEKLALAEYRANPEKYDSPEQIRVRHILIDARSCNPEERAAQLRQQAAAPGADFAALAREHSQDPGSAKRGGDLGFFGRGRMAPEFEKAAFALTNPGDLSEVVRTQFGFHIIRMEERKPAARQPFEAVREAIVRDLTAKEARSRRTAAIEGITRNMQLDQEALEAFLKQPH